MILLIIDIQKQIANNRLYRFDEFMHNVQTLITAARKNGIEVVFVRHDDGPGQPLSPGKEGYDIHEAFTPAADEIIFDKKVNSPFRECGLLEHLRSKAERELMVAGLQTEYCIDATVKCGFEHGFRMIVPAGANTTCDNSHMSARDTCAYYNEFIWNGRYAECVSMDDAIDILRRQKPR